MKLLILILAMSVGAQPLLAAACAMDMENSQQAAQQMDVDDSSGHDCCDTEESETGEDCDAGMNCGMCFVSVSALSGVPRVEPSWDHPDYLSTARRIALPSHPSPPYRPPIA